MDDPTQNTPIELSDVLTVGATVGGVRVVRIVCELEDGGKVSRRWNTRDTPQEDPDMVQTEDVELTDKQKAVLQVIESMKIGELLPTKEIAKRAGYSYAGDLRNFIGSLQKAGKLRGTTQGQRRLY